MAAAKTQNKFAVSSMDKKTWVSFTKLPPLKNLLHLNCNPLYFKLPRVESFKDMILNYLLQSQITGLQLPINYHKRMLIGNSYSYLNYSPNCNDNVRPLVSAV